jgi:hypothetical protein
MEEEKILIQSSWRFPVSPKITDLETDFPKTPLKCFSFYYKIKNMPLFFNPRNHVASFSHLSRASPFFLAATSIRGMPAACLVVTSIVHWIHPQFSSLLARACLQPPVVVLVDFCIRLVFLSCFDLIGLLD